jgi:hypothetical protein
MEDAFDESCSRFITRQWKLGKNFLFEIAEKTQVKALKSQREFDINIQTASGAWDY